MQFKNGVAIVVARYNEDLAWTLDYPFNMFDYTVYNKGPNSNFHHNHVKQVIKLPNVGRCDHTYLHHCAVRYNTLAMITVFLPGSTQTANRIDRARRTLLLIIANNYKNAYLIAQKVNVVQTWKDFSMDSHITTDPQNVRLNPERKLKKAQIRPFHKWYNYNFGNTRVYFQSMCGIFCLHRNDIVKYKSDRYQKFANLINNHSNPEVGHYFERSWAVIFYPVRHTAVIFE